ncbi:MAG: YybS family protein [Selenomonadaceae bacterium]|nr:YybS family protein [Selenomonadaceae bacterium]MBQ7493414.1 YybS family protein [Selenomonadaceae bacterium]
MGRNITPTVEGGLFVAITVIMGLVTVYVPILGMFLEFFCAVPLALLTARQGAGKGLTALVVAFILLAILISPLLAARIVLSFGICGVALGWCVKKNFGAVRIFLTTLIVASAAQVLSLWLLLVIMDVNFIETQVEMVRESFNESFAMYEGMGVDKVRINEAKSQVEPALQTLTFLMPTLLMLSALINSVAVWFTSKWIFPKLQMKLPTMPPFAEWKFPALFFYTGIIGGLGIYWGLTRGWTEIYEISLNLTIVSMIIGLLQGLALLSFIFDRYKISKIMRRIFYVILVLNMFLLQLVAITGLVDMLFDYRKRLFKD